MTTRTIASHCWNCLLWLLWLLTNSVTAASAEVVIGTYQVTRRDFPFVDPSRCRQPDFCGLSPEWDLKFGRPISASAYFPGNATHSYNVTEMNVLIFGAVRSFDEFHQILTNISSAGVVVISVHLQNKQQDFDYIQDLLRVAFDMYHENDNIHSHFYHKLSGSTVIAGFGEMADRIIWMHHPQNFVHSSIKGVISLSPSLWRDSNLLQIARNMQTDILLIAGSTDAWRPISHQRPIFNEIPSGKSRHNGVCKTYVQLQGGNHCYFIDYEPTQQTVTHCYQQEMKYGSYQSSSMSHEYQLRTYSARLILEFVTFISNPSNESANAFQSYLRNVRDTTGDIEYLQSCYVDDLFFAHDRYFPRYQHLPEYRTVV